MNAPIGLVLSGGGALGAYEVGVLRGIAEISKQETCFPIITGVSSGSINGAFLACRAANFQKAVCDLWDLWA